MDDDLVEYALSCILDDEHIGKWATEEVARRLGSSDQEDDEYWVTYTAVINELLEAVRKRNEPLLSPDIS
jgi:hypothetical protein